jgi:hypothetical protein
LFQNLIFSFQFERTLAYWFSVLLKYNFGIKSLAALANVSKHYVAIHVKDEQTDAPIPI